MTVPPVMLRYAKLQTLFHTFRIKLRRAACPHGYNEYKPAKRSRRRGNLHLSFDPLRGFLPYPSNRVRRYLGLFRQYLPGNTAHSYRVFLFLIKKHQAVKRIESVRHHIPGMKITRFGIVRPARPFVVRTDHDLHVGGIHIKECPVEPSIPPFRPSGCGEEDRVIVKKRDVMRQPMARLLVHQPSFVRRPFLIPGFLPQRITFGLFVYKSAEIDIKPEQ